MQHETNFVSDWIQMMRKGLAHAGVKVKPNLTEDQLSITFWTFVLRSVTAQPRKVLKAAEFSCPADDQAGLDALEQKFIDGADVNAHLSNTRFRASGKHYTTACSTTGAF